MPIINPALIAAGVDMIRRKMTPKRYCWTGIPETGGLTGGYGKNLAECRRQARKKNVNIHEKYMYFEGRTPKDLLRKVI